jgi:hypothetical protein
MAFTPPALAVQRLRPAKAGARRVVSPRCVTPVAAGKKAGAAAARP